MAARSGKSRRSAIFKHLVAAMFMLGVQPNQNIMALDTPCVGYIAKVDSACGCTLTRTTITGFTGADIEALANKEVALTKAILDAAEAKMLGVPENPLMTLLNGKTKNIKLQTHTIDEQSIVMPFNQRTQRTVINANYFTVTTGVPSATAGVGAEPASTWQLTLGLGNSTFQSTLGNIERYFVPGHTLIVKTWDGVDTKTARTLVFTIYSATHLAATTCTVKVYPPVSAANWVLYTPAERSVWQPLFGMAEVGHNSIADEESYCEQQPSDINRNLNVTWLQTARESYCREAAYEKVLSYIMAGKVNDYLKTFKYISIAEQEKQKKARYDQEFFNTVFWDRLSTLTTRPRPTGRTSPSSTTWWTPTARWPTRRARWASSLV